MSLLEIVVIFTTFIVIFIFLGVCIIKLIRVNDCLVRFIMGQKDITAFNQSLPIVKNKIKKDKEIEKRTKDYIDYMNLVNSGICEDKDVKRFGTLSVDQG